MKRYCGLNAENFMKLFNTRNVMRYNVFADDGEPTGDGNGDPNGNSTPTGDPAPQVNFEQLIQKAREEEKNKLYPRIKKLEEQNSNYVKIHNDDLIAIATKDKEIERLNGEIKTLNTQLDGKESEAVKTLKEDLKAAQDELQNLKDSAPNEEEIRANIRQEIDAEYALKFYREKKIQEAQGRIIPELVSGNTEEEIDTSVAKAISRYNEIAGTATPQSPVNPKVNPANPSGSPAKTTSDAMKALLELDPLSPEYAEARKAFGFK